MTITVTAFRWVPPFAQGLVRDLRVRWALEELGLPYTQRLMVQNLAVIDLFYPDAQWGKERRPGAVEMVTSRLSSLSSQLEGRSYLEGQAFSAADLLMATVLRNLRQTDLLAKFPVLDSYRQRCEDRPAFQKAVADQLRVFAEHAPS